MPNPYFNKRLLVGRSVDIFPGPTPDFWLDAGRIQGVASGGAIQTWPDASPNNRDFTQPTLGSRPLLTTGLANNRPAATFALGKDMTNTNLVATRDWTYFFVTQNTGSALQFIWYQGDATDGYGFYVSTTHNIQVRNGGGFTNMTGTNAMATNVPVLWTIRRLNATPLTELWINGVAETLSSNNGAQGVPNTTGTLGGFPGGVLNWGQHIYEAIGYSTVLLDSQRVEIERYLRHKYAF